MGNMLEKVHLHMPSFLHPPPKGLVREEAPVSAGRVSLRLLTR